MAKKISNIHDLLQHIQTELKVLKERRNQHGNFNFRSMEDINQALKPLLKEYGATFTVSDDLVMVGDRYYIKATATLTDIDGNSASAIGWAREADQQRGMNSAQLTGSTSSYARKYAANGLFALDDNKDADDFMSEEQIKEQEESDRQRAVDALKSLILSLPIDKQKEELNWVLETEGIKKIEDISYRSARIVWKAIKERNK